MDRPATANAVNRLVVLLAPFLLALVAPRSLTAQERGATALGEAVAALGVSARVLMIGAHPDDEDTRLITWLARGRHVETAYLSLTRGDGGQNLIGNELGEALGAIRTEELLAARRIDGARQYFTRAYDFGYSKNADEAYRHWPKDSLLGDVVGVVREFRPHIIVAVFSGTARDGHGQHTVSGLVAREAYRVAGDSVRFPRDAFGAPWTVLKLYRGSYYADTAKSVTFNVGEYDPLLGRSYSEIAAESRSQHKSQAFGSLPRKGAQMSFAEREASRVPAPADPKAERSMFDGIDTTLARVRASLCPAGRVALDSVMAIVSRVKQDVDLAEPSPIVAPLASAYRLTEATGCGQIVISERCTGWAACGAGDPDASATVSVLQNRLRRALLLASGVAVEATVPREIIARGDSVPLTVTIYNRGRAPVRVIRGGTAPRPIAPDSAFSDTTMLRYEGASFESREGEKLEMMQPLWLFAGRVGDMFRIAWQPRSAPRLGTRTVAVEISRVRIPIDVPIVHRFADPVEGEVTRPLAFAPAVSVTLDRMVEYAPARTALVRQLRVQLRSAATSPRNVRVSLKLPAGLRVDSASRTVSLPEHGSIRSVTFTLRGQLPPGRHTIAAVAESGGETFATGYTLIDYDHIRPLRLYRDAKVEVEAVDVKLPPDAVVAYIQGVGDNSAPMLQQLGVRTTLLDPEAIPSTDLSRYTAIVVGTRAYEASDALFTNNAALLDYVRKGGTMVVQYGQTEMLSPGIMPYPITLSRPADRVTDEGSAVRVLDPKARLLNWPNEVTARDFEGWVQDRSLYMPRTFDPRFTPLLATNDPGEPENRGALLVAPYGSGSYVYTTLAFFRQLPAGVPGAARLFVNLLAARGAVGRVAQ